jgi:hypothetical protein
MPAPKRKPRREQLLEFLLVESAIWLFETFVELAICFIVALS